MINDKYEINFGNTISHWQSTLMILSTVFFLHKDAFCESRIAELL